MTKKTPKPAKIHSKKLSAMCHLGERRLRQLADEGRIPRPDNGMWPMLETLRGLFRYYQRDGEELTRERLLKLAAQRRLAEMEVGRNSRELLDRGEVGRLVRNFGMNQRLALQKRLEVELPDKLVGLSVGQIRQAMRDTVDLICNIMADGCSQWIEQPPPAPAATTTPTAKP